MCSDHRLVRAKIVINLKKTRTKLVNRKKRKSRRGNQSDEFKVALRNKFEALDQNDEDLEEVNRTIMKTIFETAIEVGGKTTKQYVNKLSQSTKDLIKEHQQMKMASSKDTIEFAERSKLIRKAMQRDVRNFNVREIEQ